MAHAMIRLLASTMLMAFSLLVASASHTQAQQLPPDPSTRPQTPDPQLPDLGGYDYGPNILLYRDTEDSLEPILAGTLGRAVGVGPDFLAPLVANGSASPPAGKAGSAPPPRLEIREFRKNPYSWNLYILAMSMMQWENQTSPKSWYQLAGIHGLPYVPWNNVLPIPGSEDTGYCTHLSVLFPTWHRPYLSLVEQVLVGHAHRIASWFPEDERSRYIDAASRLRLPYWDWALAPEAGEHVFIDEFTTPGIEAYGPAGWQTIANPLYSYRFRPIDHSAFIHIGVSTHTAASREQESLVADLEQLNVWTQTLRAPTSLTEASAVSQNAYVVQAIDQAQGPLQSRLYNILSNYPHFNAFSTKRWGQVTNQSIGTYDSCEGLHDTVHMMVGQRGHFQYLAYSAFDPIFFLHHTSVDRIVALWQVINPNSWIGPLGASEATFTTAMGAIQDAKTPLTPMRSDLHGGFWTSDMVRDLTVLGYSYADLHLDAATPKEQRQRVIASVNTLYGGSTPFGFLNRSGSTAKRNRHAKKPLTQVDWENKPDFSHGILEPKPARDAILKNGRYNEWIANIRASNGVLGGSFSVHIFLGQLPEYTQDFVTAPNLVGTMGVFAMAPRPGRTSHNSLVTGTVPLTRALLRLVAMEHLPSLEPNVVVPFLQRRLRYRVVDGMGNLVDTTPELRLHITIVTAKVEAPKTLEELPRWGPQITQLIVEG